MRQFFLRDYVKNAVRVFFLGIILGIILIFLCRNRLQTDIYLLNEEWIVFMQSAKPDSKSLFIYILFRRLKEIGLLVLFATTFAGIVCMYGFIGVMGVGTGVLLAISCLRYGVKGLMLVLVASFPQALLYLPTFLYIFHLCYFLCVKLYFPHKDYWKTNNPTKVFLFKNTIYICMALGVVIIGIFLESYVNPKIIFPFVKNF